MLAWKHFWLSRQSPAPPGWETDRRSTLPPALREVTEPTSRRVSTAALRRLTLVSYDLLVAYDDETTYLTAPAVRRVSTAAARRESTTTQRRS